MLGVVKPRLLQVQPKACPNVRVKQLVTLYPVIEFKVEGETQVESEVQVKHSMRSGKLFYKGANPG